MSALLFDPDSSTDRTLWQPAPMEAPANDQPLQLSAMTPTEATALPPLDDSDSSDFSRPPVGSFLADTVGGEAAALFDNPRDIEAQMQNAVFLSREEGVPLSVMVPLLPLYEQKYSQALYGEDFQSPVRFLEKTQQPITDEQAEYLTLTPSQRVERKKEEYSIILGQPGYGIEPPQLSPDGLSVAARQKQIDEMKANKSPATLSPGFGGAYMPGVAFQNRPEVEDLEARQALHIAKVEDWRKQLITPQNIAARAIQEVGTQEGLIDQTIGNRSFQTWAQDYHGVQVADPVELIGGSRRSSLTDPAIRRLAEEYWLTQPGSGQILWDAVARGGKGAFSNTGAAVSGSLGVAFSAAGFEDLGATLKDFGEGAQMEARRSTDLRLDGTAPAVVAEGVGELAAFVLSATAVTKMALILGASEKGAAIASTFTSGGLGAASNSWHLYLEAKNYGANDQDAQLAAGIGAIVGITTAIPVAQWALRLENGSEVWRIVSRMVFDATETGLQGSSQQLANNVIAQQVFDRNRYELERVADAAALSVGLGSIVSVLTTAAAYGKTKVNKDRRSEIRDTVRGGILESGQKIYKALPEPTAKRLRHVFPWFLDGREVIAPPPLGSTVNYKPSGAAVYDAPLILENNPNQENWIAAPNGSIDWGHISEQVSIETNGLLKNGAIRIQFGFHKSKSMGFGWVHAEDHTDDFINSGRKNQEEFLMDVLVNFDEIWLQENGKLALVKRREPNAKFKDIAVVRLDIYDGFYGITTAYPEKNHKDLTKKGVKVWP